MQVEIAHQYRIPRHLGNHHCTCTRTSPQCFRKRPLESSCACLRCTHPRLWESVKIMFEIGEKSFFRGLNLLTIPLNVTDMYWKRPALSIGWYLGYSHLPHNRCLWIPFGIHTCSLSGRSHSGKRQSGGRCFFCKRSVGNSNEMWLRYSVLLIFLYFLSPDEGDRIYWS